METKTPPEDNLLQRYLDGLLDEKQSKELEHRVRTSPAWSARLEELRFIHTSLSASARIEIPSKNFTEQVMGRLDSFPVLSGFSPKNGLFLLCGVLVAVGIALMMLQAGFFDSARGMINLDALPLKKEWIRNPLPAIPFNGKIMINVILIIVTGLSFVVLDRTILRPVFGRRSLKLKI
jgi:hypothetical protein